MVCDDGHMNQRIFAMPRVAAAGLFLAGLALPAMAVVPAHTTQQVAQGLAWVDPWIPALLLVWLALGAWSWWRVSQPARQQRQLRAQLGAAAPRTLPLRWPLWLAAVALVCVALLSWAVVSPAQPLHATFMAWDAAAQTWSQNHVQGTLRTVLRSLTDMGDVLWLAVLSVLMAVRLAVGRQWLALQVWVFAVGLNGLSTRVLKNAFARPRPEALHDMVTSGASFPSGHTAGAVVVYGLLYYLLRPRLSVGWRRGLGAALLLLVVLISASRVWLEAHFASDVVAGGMLGVAILGLAVWALERGQD